ncbi:putative mitochondrial protein [Andalucia godoyi]|uniref:Putative mitochondrial protein n=1 Tax=Andalucia godoyi TaxID=505711 RepID=A0A8K0AGR0_ANDGO|nr:putative mitochondrial protein [Andalucia godoyi]|eukprot:ANDGO_05169.mRNA.1 putative mitochondrial protein
MGSKKALVRPASSSLSTLESLDSVPNRPSSSCSSSSSSNSTSLHASGQSHLFQNSTSSRPLRGTIKPRASVKPPTSSGSRTPTSMTFPLTALACSSSSSISAPTPTPYDELTAFKLRELDAQIDRDLQDHDSLFDPDNNYSSPSSDHDRDHGNDNDNESKNRPRLDAVGGSDTEWSDLATYLNHLHEKKYLDLPPSLLQPHPQQPSTLAVASSSKQVLPLTAANLLAATTDQRIIDGLAQIRQLDAVLESLDGRGYPGGFDDDDDGEGDDNPRNPSRSKAGSGYAKSRASIPSLAPLDAQKYYFVYGRLSEEDQRRVDALLDESSSTGAGAGAGGASDEEPSAKQTIEAAIAVIDARLDAMHRFQLPRGTDLDDAPQSPQHPIEDIDRRLRDMYTANLELFGNHAELPHLEPEVLSRLLDDAHAELGIPKRSSVTAE